MAQNLNENITLDLHRLAQREPTLPALILESEEVDYAAFDDLVWKSASLLHAAGVRAGDAVGVVQGNDLVRALTTLGLMRLGASVMPLARAFSAFQVNALASTVGLSRIVTDGPLGSEIRTPATQISLGAIRSQAVSDFGVLCEEPPVDCILAPGSGSTGRQKIIPQSHAILRRRIGLAFPNDKDLRQERILSFTNLEFVSGINRLLSVIGVGGASVILNGALKSVPDYCKAQAISRLFCSVFHAEQIIRLAPPTQGPLLPTLNSLRISGSSVSLSLRQRVRDVLTPNLEVVYGTNECGRVSIASAPGVFEDQFSVGPILEGVEVEVVNAEGVALPPGQRGEIRVRTPSLVPGYVGDPEASAKHFRGGWFYTGDVGEFAEDGSLRHFGRTDGMMILNGINIYPTEIEQTIKEIPGVRDTVVMRLRHEVSQDIPVAVVSVDASAKLDARQVHAIAKDRLGFRAPREIFLVGEIPRNANGKVQKEELMRMVNSARKA